MVKKLRTLEIVGEEADNEMGIEIFVVADGKKIAKRGLPGTPQAKTWISLEPGYACYSSPDMSELSVEFNGVPIH